MLLLQLVAGQLKLIRAYLVEILLMKKSMLSGYANDTSACWGSSHLLTWKGVSQDDPSITGKLTAPSHSIITSAAIYTYRSFFVC